jgi:putative transposase
VLCQTLEVSQSGYYAWKNREQSQQCREDARLSAAIQQIFLDHLQVYGSPRIHAVLKARGISCGRKRVVRLMQQLGLSAQVKKRRKPTTRSTPFARFAPNQLNREFAASVPNQKWVTDTKVVETAEGRLYLAVLLDLFSRMVVGWAMAATEDGQLVELALRIALATRHPPTGLLHHSDRGSEFTSEQYQALLREAGFDVSMSRTGDCYDNAAMEAQTVRNPQFTSDLGDRFAAGLASRISELAPAPQRLCPGANQGNLPSSEFVGEQQAFHCLARDQIGRPAPNFPAHGLPLEYPDQFPAH